jgi:hypothetical protein
VDEVGGLPTAVERAAELAGIDPKLGVRLVEIPAPKTLLQELLAHDDRVGETLAALRERMRLFIEEGRLAPRREQVLEMPFVPRVW